MKTEATKITQNERAFFLESLPFVANNFEDLTHQQKVFFVTACMAVAFPERRADLIGKPSEYLGFVVEALNALASRSSKEQVLVDSSKYEILKGNFQTIYDQRGLYLSPEDIVKELVEVGILQKVQDEYLILGKSANGLVRYGECDYLLIDGKLELEVGGIRYARVLKFHLRGDNSYYILDSPQGVVAVINQQVINQIGEIFPDSFYGLTFNFENKLQGIYLNEGDSYIFYDQEVCYQLDGRPLSCFFSEAFTRPTGYVVTENSVSYFLQGELQGVFPLEEFNVRTVNFSFAQLVKNNINISFWGTCERNSRDIPFIFGPIESLPDYGEILETHQFLYYHGKSYGEFSTERGLVFGLGQKFCQTLCGETITRFIPSPNFLENGQAIVKTEGATFPMYNGVLLTQIEGARILNFIPIESTVNYENVTGWVVTNSGSYLFIDGHEIKLNNGLSFYLDPNEPPQIYVDHLKAIYFVGHALDSEKNIKQLVLLASSLVDFTCKVEAIRDLHVAANGDFKCLLDGEVASSLFHGQRQAGGYTFQLEDIDASDLSLVGFGYFGQTRSKNGLKTFLGQEMVAHVSEIKIANSVVLDEETHLAVFESSKNRGLVLGGKILYEGEKFKDFHLSEELVDGRTQVNFQFERNSIKHFYGFRLF